MPENPIDWAAIRPLNGNRSAGFEELTTQLARYEQPIGARFERKGTPDAGVECYAILPRGDEWGWQAKYFLSALGTDQWGELDSSVATVLEKHPRLVRYYVCVPRDRSDGRVDRKVTSKTGAKPGASSTATKRQVSEKDQWDAHVKKWQEWAAKRGMSVEFIFWGSHQLLDRLAQSQHVGRCQFWFGKARFDDQWFRNRLDEAVKTAGARYTPEIHVDLPIAAEFEAFGRTEKFFDSIKARARDLRERLKSFRHYAPKPAEPKVPDAPQAVRVVEATEGVLEALGNVKPVAAGILPFAPIIDQVNVALEAVKLCDDALEPLEREHAEKERKDKAVSPSGWRSDRNPFYDQRVALSNLEREFRNLMRAVKHAEDVASKSLMLLEGDAGTGKTHLLCDVARHRIENGRPTVLLMGQLLIAIDDPWTQALRTIDLADVKAEEFVGALEAAAQAARCRVLVLVDALNEGAGRRIWPDHLATFLARLERSPWIGVVLSIRSSYTALIIPEEVSNRAARFTHSGFASREYDATRTFFDHYELELPSVPILIPEFRNPLFLKTLCRGLHGRGERRVPRGFHGISAVFGLFFDVVNARLSERLGYNAKINLVVKALTSLAGEIVQSAEAWVRLSEAEFLVNQHLPNRDFDRSLYHGLVLEGVLIEDVRHPEGSVHEDVVYVAYERFADHLVARVLLDTHVDPGAPEAAFAEGGPLSYLGDPKHYVPAGVLEALCVQIPERMGKELPLLVPQVKGRWGAADAFRRSLIWRSVASCSEDSRMCLNEFLRTDDDWTSTLNTLLTLAALPGHFFNARFLDRRLRKGSMADRDALWSAYLHRSWKTQGATDRLIDWAWSVRSEDSIEDEVVHLCSIALGWMLSTPNRFVRDRATKALVALLSGRYAATVTFVEHFAGVNDPYIAERVYAVAYGVSMRGNDMQAIGKLALCVYREVFESGTPPAHILLRDYARGVVERAIYLGALMEIHPERIRPPYASVWPNIPTEEDIASFQSDWSRGSYDSGDAEWSRNRIASSVLHDDFGRYVIGTNSSATSWLSLRLEDQAWCPPATPQERRVAFAAKLSDEELTAWTVFQEADASFILKMSSILPAWMLFPREEAEESTTEGVEEAIEDTLTSDEDLPHEHKGKPPELEAAELAWDTALSALEAVLTLEHKQELELILEAERTPRACDPVRFDLKMIQRYVIWRVFDLGWTKERFGNFDRFEVQDEGRAANKAERFGKKYQWIAFHEISALVADHFQYREQFYEAEGDQAYDGPWQDGLRDIDPSCGMRSKPGGTSWSGHVPSWWGTATFRDWKSPVELDAWLKRHDNHPDVAQLLLVCDKKDGSAWLNVDGYFDWEEPTPVDQRSSDVERRELWYLTTGYLIHEEDAEAFMGWAEGVDFWGRWMPESRETYRMFLGEYAWSAASRYFHRESGGDRGWVLPENNCPAAVRSMTFEYLCEQGFDCSIDDGYRLNLPAQNLVVGMGVRWNGRSAEFIDSSGRIAVFDPTADANGPTALLIRQSSLEEFLKRERLAICWTVIGEKRSLRPSREMDYQGALQMTGAYLLRHGKVTGFMKYLLDVPTQTNGRSKQLLGVARTNP